MSYAELEALRFIAICVGFGGVVGIAWVMITDLRRGSER